MKSEIVDRSCKRSSVKPSKKARLAYIRKLAIDYMHLGRSTDESRVVLQQMVDECKRMGLDQQEILNSIADEMRKPAK